MSHLSPDDIALSNEPVWAAIAAVRLERNPFTMSCLYDALNRRRRIRDTVMPDWMVSGWRHEIDRDRRNYGQVVRTHHELAAAVDRHRPTEGF